MNLNRYFLISQNTLADLKEPKVNSICTMDDTDTDAVSPVLIIRQHQHHDRFYRFRVECPEISAHTQELIVSVHVSCPDVDVTVSDRDHEECQNSGVSDEDKSQFIEFIFFKVCLILLIGGQK